MVSRFSGPGSGDWEAVAAAFARPPEIILYPETVEEISEVLGFASRNGLRVFPFGGGTKLFLGNPPAAPCAALSMRNLDGIVFHEPSDMVAAVRCGAPVRSFQETVGVHGQIFPVDPPYLDSGATVGGLLSSNLCGPMSTRYGTCRELILGARAVRADGEIISVGGRVVKNVAGYDVAKLLVGSLGTLCVVAEATFRLYPAPRSSKTALLGFSDPARCRRAAGAALDAEMVPSCLEVLDGNLSSEILPELPRAAAAVAIRFDGFERATAEQAAAAKEIAAAEDAVFVEPDGGRSSSIWERIREFPFDEAADLFCRMTLPIRDSIGVTEDIAREGAVPGARLRCLSRPARGVVLVSVSGKEASADAARFLENLARSRSGGIMFCAPSSKFPAGVGAWGDFGDAVSLMKNMRKRFDPSGALCGEKMFGVGGAARAS